MQEFADGATAAICVAIALFFWRFWRDTDDRLFGLLAVAFVIFALNRVVLTALDEDSEQRTIVYAVRLCAFALIAGAIIDKNRGQR